MCQRMLEKQLVALGRASQSRGPGRQPGASLYTRKRLSLTGARAGAAPLLYTREHLSLSLSPSDRSLLR